MRVYVQFCDDVVLLLFSFFLSIHSSLPFPKFIRGSNTSIKTRSPESGHVVIPYHEDGERQLLGDMDLRFLSDVTVDFGPGGREECTLCGASNYGAAIITTVIGITE